MGSYEANFFSQNVGTGASFGGNSTSFGLILGPNQGCTFVSDHRRKRKKDGKGDWRTNGGGKSMISQGIYAGESYGEYKKSFDSRLLSTSV